MNQKKDCSMSLLRSIVALACAAVMIPGDTLLQAQQTQPQSAQAQTSSLPNAPSATAKIPPDQLDSLVAPIALYPDPLLAQVLAASTYPLEIVQLEQWLEKNKELKDKALADAVAKQPWDPSIQALAALPDVVKRMADDIQWTADLGNAFLAQQSNVMDSVQRMRKKAQDKGSLKSGEQMKVETRTVESKQVIVIEQSDPQVVYVPSYDPVVVYGAASPYYPYPYYPYYGGGYYAAGVAISFGVGMMMGAFWSGGWGWGCGWGNNDININRNNNFNRNTNIGGGQNRPGGGNGIGNGNRPGGGNGIGNGNRPGGGNGIGGGNRPSQQPAGGNRWQHNPEHRGGAPYKDRATADRFGGTTRGDSLSNRQSSARNQLGRQGGSLASNRGTGASNRSLGSFGNGSRGSSGFGGGRGGADRAGSRDVGGGGNGRGGSGFGNGRGSYSGSSARSSGSRGSSSMSRGGGGRGGGGRGGGGRR
jgi:hypothetical protein